MKKKITLLTLILFTLTFMFTNESLNAQIKGVNKNSAVFVTTAEELTENFGSLVRAYDEEISKDIYFIMYPKTPLGLRACLRDTFYYVELNGLDFYEDTFYNDYLITSYVEDLTDFETLHISILKDYSTITRVWKINYYSGIMIRCNKDGYILAFLYDMEF